MLKMLKKDLEFDWKEEMNEEELDELIEKMEKYTVKLPSEQEIKMTMEVLREHMPTAEKEVHAPRRFVALGRAFEEITFLDNSYWLISASLFLFGFIVVLMNGEMFLGGNQPYKLAMLFSPIPFVLGVMEVFKGREEGMIELELSCRVSIAEMIMARLVIVSIYNVLLNSLMTGVFMSIGTGILLWRITLMWLTPFTLVAAITLMIVPKIRGGYMVMMFATSWMVVAMSILSQDKVMERLMRLNLGVYGVLTAIGVLLLGIQILRFGNREGRFFKECVMNEAKD